MSIARLPNPFRLELAPSTGSAVLTTVNAAGESVAIVGRLRLQSSASGSKTISTSGGKIWWRPGGLTFASGSTNIRVGIQDVDATTGLEDGTFDVYADHVGGSGTLTNNVFNKSAMGTGSKTIANGDIIAIVVEMTARGASDSVQPHIAPPLVYDAAFTIMGFPYGTVDTGTLSKAATAALVALIEFDDGTMGWIDAMGMPLATNAASLTYNSGSSPDEYASCFTMPMTLEICGYSIVRTTNDAVAPSIAFYQDPFGTPVLLDGPTTPDVDILGGVSNINSIFMPIATPITLVQGQTYGIASRAVSGTNITMRAWDLQSGLENMKLLTPFGTTLKLGSRSGGSGAFADAGATKHAGGMLLVSGFEAGYGEAGYQMGVI